MNLSSGLPYSAGVYAALMADYVTGWLAVVAGLLGLGIWLFWQSLRGRISADRMQRTAGALLAVMAAWIGWAHQWRMMADLNFLAPVYAAAWWAFAGWLMIRLVFRPPQLSNAAPNPSASDRHRSRGAALMALALAAYPAAQWLGGIDPLALDLVGSGPNATSLFAVGALAAFAPGWRRADLFVVPALWGGVAGLHGILLGQQADLLVPAIMLLAGGWFLVSCALDYRRARSTS